jgi:hypothetical protein
MSHAHVREEFRTAARALLEPAGFVFFESINFATQSKSLPPHWFTLEFIVGDEGRAALGVPSLMREQGTVAVQIYSEQQVTDAATTQAADMVRDAFTNWADATGQLRVIDCAPAVDIDGGDFRGAFYGVFVSVRYLFDRLVNQSPIT